MKISKAIEIQDLYLHHSDQWNHQDLDTAIKLGIEALKHIKATYTYRGNYIPLPLPGEEPE